MNWTALAAIIISCASIAVTAYSIRTSYKTAKYLRNRKR